MGGQDRLAVSVVWTVDAAALAQGRLILRSTWFGRTLIRSRHQVRGSEHSDCLLVLTSKHSDSSECYCTSAWTEKRQTEWEL